MEDKRRKARNVSGIASPLESAATPPARAGRGSVVALLLLLGTTLCLCAPQARSADPSPTRGATVAPAADRSTFLSRANELGRGGGTLPGLPVPDGWEGGSSEGRSPLDPNLTWARSSTGPEPLRSPRLSFLLSAILPGAGQLYNGSRRGYAFLAVEASSWFVRTSYLDAADRKEADYRAYADRYWDFDRFKGSENSPGCGFAPGADVLLEQYRVEDPVRYYAQLATGDDYRCGWADAAFDSGTDEVVSDHRTDYRNQRERSNTFQSRAGLALGVLVLNRVVSAVDAFRLARGKELGNAPSFRITGELDGDVAEPRAVFRLTKEFP